MRTAAAVVIVVLLVSVILPPARGQTDSEEEPGWTKMNPEPRPDPLRNHAMVYASRSDRVILFGGLGTNGVTNETWSYDFNDNSWVNLGPGEAPPGRATHALAYDAESERVILYGGNLGTKAGEGSADTWAFDYDENTWTNVTPVPSPPPRDATSLAYDSESDRVILFGGRAPPGNFPQNDTWSYDFNTNTWTEMNPVVRPPARVYHTMAYDEESDRVILFGGATNGLVRMDTWSYDFNTNTWTDMSPTLGPDQRDRHGMAYDSRADLVFVFGGTAGYDVPFTNETWAYDYNQNRWTNLTTPRSPSHRNGLALAYDAESNRIVLFGGNAPSRSNETWAFLFVPSAPGLAFDPLIVAVLTGLVLGVTVVVLWWWRRRPEEVIPSKPL